MLSAIDLFCGGGGFSEGARWAGLHVTHAFDDWSEGLDCHEANHKYCEHHLVDLNVFDPRNMAEGYDVLLASPPCTGHTKARGKEGNEHGFQRDLSWVVNDWVAEHRPKAFVVENVPEMMRKWKDWGMWCYELRGFGYGLGWTVIDAADCGVPQNRKRLIVVGVRGADDFMMVPPKLPKHLHAPFYPIVRWDEGKWSSVEGKAESTLVKVRYARHHGWQRFLVPYYGGQSNARSLQRPIGTITTRDRFAVVDGDRMRTLLVEECRDAMGFPPDYLLPDKATMARKVLGNAVCPAVSKKVLEMVKEMIA